MAIITLTTDVGHRDFYQSAIKGAILSLSPAVNIVDISHQIAPFNIAQAAYVIGNAWRFFPAGTVHIIGIDTHYQASPRYLVVSHEGQHFVGPDNGIFSLLFEQMPEQLVEINLQADQHFQHFPLLDVLVKTATRLADGSPPAELGTPTREMNQRDFIHPVYGPDHIRANVIHIDSFQNVITNIRRKLFEELWAGRPFELFFSRYESIREIHRFYNEVPEGEKLCLFGISGYLEIAINKGNASGLLGLNIGDSVIVQFEEGD